MTTEIPSTTPIAAITDPAMLEFAHEAQRFIASFAWCGNVTGGGLVQALPGLGVFLMELVPTRIGVPNTIWVVVSQEPLARSVCDWADDWKDALKHHVEQIRQWMKAKRAPTSLPTMPSGFDLTEDVEKQIEARLACFEKILAESWPARATPSANHREPY